MALSATAIDRAIAASEPRGTVSIVPRVRGYMDSAAMPARWAGELTMYNWVDPEEIPARFREMVRGHVYQLAIEMRIAGEIEVRWYRPSSDARGHFSFRAKQPGELPSGLSVSDEHGHLVALNASMSGDELIVQSVAHEMDHLKQSLERAALADEEWCERRADAFAGEYVARVFG